MKLSMKHALMSATAFGLICLMGGCATPTPLPQAGRVIPETLKNAGSEAAPQARLSWHDVVAEPKLRAIMDLALAHNQDLKIATLNIDRARQGLVVAHAGFFPNFSANLSDSRVQTPASVSSSGHMVETDTYSANLALNPYEIDLFGRIRAAGRAANETVLSTVATRKSVRIGLINAVGQAWLTLGADRDLLRLSRETLRTRYETLEIARKRAKIGVASDIEVNSLTILTEQARADALAAETRCDQDVAALEALTGAAVPENLLPEGLPDTLALNDPAVGLSSEVLLNRADVVAAEHALKAQSANMDVARAAFFPRLSLTASDGSASRALSDLFTAGTHAWTVVPQLTLPIFTGGANLANYRTSRLSRDVALVTYDKTLQGAFAEVEQALAVRTRVSERLISQQTAYEAARTNATLEQARLEHGMDSYLNRLETERSLYGAEQALIGLRLVKLSTSLSLYKALGTDAE